MIDLHDTLVEPPLRVRFAPGSTGRLVVSFSGVGTKRRQEPPTEFFKTAGGGVNPILFVTDQSRSWLNGKGMAESICRAILAKAEELATTELIFIGNSMGASMALHLACLMPVSRVIAFTPQFSACPTVIPTERRWAFFRSKIAEFRFRCIDTWPDAASVFVLHGADTSELRHARMFPDATDAVDHFILPGHDHNLASQLRQNGHLSGLVQNMMDGRRWRVRKALQDLGGTGRCSYLKSQSRNAG